MGNTNEVISKSIDNFWPTFIPNEFHKMMSEFAETDDITNTDNLKQIFKDCTREIMKKYHQTGIGNHQEVTLMIFEILVDEYGFDIHMEHMLHWAFINDNLLLVKYLFDKGVNPNNIPISDLVWPINNNRLDICQMYIEYGLNMHNPDIFTYAILNSNTEIIKFLLDAGVEIAPNDFIRAVNRNDILIVKLLIEYGANVSCNNNKPILAAIRNISPDMVKLLLKHGACVKDMVVKESNKTKICDVLRDYNVSESNILKVLISDNDDFFVD